MTRKNWTGFSQILFTWVTLDLAVAQLRDVCSVVTHTEEFLTWPLNTKGNSTSFCLDGPLDRFVFANVEDDELLPYYVPTGHKVSIDCQGRGFLPYIAYREATGFNGVIVARGGELELNNCGIFLFENMAQGTRRDSQAPFADFGNNPDSIVSITSSHVFSPPQYKEMLSDPGRHSEYFVRLPTWPLEVASLIELDDAWAVTVVRGHFHPGSTTGFAIDAANYTLFYASSWSPSPPVVRASWQLTSSAIGASLTNTAPGPSMPPATLSEAGNWDASRLVLLIVSIAVVTGMLFAALGVLMWMRRRRRAAAAAADAEKADARFGHKSVCFSFAHATARSLSTGSTPRLHPYLAQQLSGAAHDGGSGLSLSERRRSIMSSNAALWCGASPMNGATLQDALDQGHLKRATLRGQWEGVLGVLQDVAADLQLVHNAGQVHGHLLPANISLHVPSDAMSLAAAFENGDVLSSLPGVLFSKAGRRIGSDVVRCYRAPEVAAGAPPTTDADVYSFGVLMWSLMDTHGSPSASLSKVAMGRSALCSNDHPPSASSGGNWEPQDKFSRLSEAVPMTYMLAGMACISRQRKDRPTIKDVLVLLNAVEQEVESGEYVDSQGRARSSTDVRLIFAPLDSAALTSRSADTASNPSSSNSIAAGTGPPWKSPPFVISELPTG